MDGTGTTVNDSLSSLSTSFPGPYDRATKKRSARWLDKEEQTLIEEVLERESLLFGDLKGPGAKNSIGKRRAEAWAAIAHKLSVQFTNTKRSAEEVKKKYFNLKQRAKEKIEKERRNLRHSWALPQAAKLRTAEQILMKSLEAKPSAQRLAGSSDTDDEDLKNKKESGTSNTNSHPGTEMCLTSKAVHTIMNTNEPLNLNQAWPTADSGDIDMYPGFQSINESLVKVEKPEESEEYPTKYRKILPNTLRNVILKRVSDVDLPAESSPVESSPVMTSSPNKRARSERADSEYNGTDTTENFHNGMDEYDHVTEDSMEAPTFQPFYNAEYETDNFMKLNKEVLELKKKKLLTKIEKLEFERESAENDRDRSKVEKETAMLLQEKVKLELEMLKKKAENT